MTHSRMMTILFAGLLVQLFACGESELPSGVIDSERLAEVYVSLVENEEMLERWSAFNTGKFSPDTVLSRHGVTQEEIEATIQYFNEDVRRWKEFYSRVVRIHEGGKKE